MKSPPLLSGFGARQKEKCARAASGQNALNAQEQY